MFIAAQFTIDKKQNQTKCPSTYECIKKMFYIYVYIYAYNRILLSHKKNAIMPHETTWVDIEINLLRELKSKRKRKISYNLYM